MAKSNESSLNRLQSISPVWNMLFSVLLILLGITIIVPLILVVIISFTSAESIAFNGYSFFPSSFTTYAYQNLAYTGTQLLNSYLITIFYAVAGTVLTLLVTSLFSFSIAQRKFRARRALTFFAFFTMLFSGGLVPAYIINVTYLHLNDTVWIFLLPGLISAWYAIMLRTFIQSSVPETLFESAKIDGANDLLVYFRIALPLMKAGLATIGLFVLVGKWNDWFTGMLYIKKASLVPLQTLLQRIQNNLQFIKQNADFASSPEGMEMLRNLPTESMRMAITVIVTLPILFVYPYFQRYFIQGITIGSVKG